MYVCVCICVCILGIFCFLYSFISGYLGCFHVFTTVWYIRLEWALECRYLFEIAILFPSIIYIYIHTYIYIYNSGIPGLQVFLDWSIFNFLRNFHTIFNSTCPNFFIFLPQCTKVPISLQHYQHSLFLIYLIEAILPDGRWYLSLWFWLTFL